MIKQSEDMQDVLALDLCEVYCATSGQDNRITIWNTFTGGQKAKIQLPKRVAGVFVNTLRFL